MFILKKNYTKYLLSQMKIHVSVKKINYLYLSYSSDDMHKALRTRDLLEIIFNLLDLASLDAAFETCQLWQEVISETSLWKKFAHKLSKRSLQNFTVLTTKGLNEKFQEHSEESNHFRKTLKEIFVTKLVLSENLNGSAVVKKKLNS